MAVTAVIDIRVRGQKELTKLQKQTKLIRSLLDGIKPVPSLFDSTQIGMTKGLGEEIKKLKDGLKELATNQKSFRGTTASLNRQLNTTRDLLGNLSRKGNEWKHTLVAVERAQVAVAKAEQATMTQRMKSLSSGSTALGRDVVGGVLAQSSKIAQSRDALSAYREELSRLFNAVEIGSKHYVQLEAAIKKVDEQLAKPKPKKAVEVIGGITGREKELKKALDLQNKLDSSAVGYKDAVLGVRKAQEAYNRELAQSVRQQRFVNAGVIAQKAALSGVINLVKNIPRGIGDIGKLLGGGFGKPAAFLGGTAGAAGIIAFSRQIEKIAQQLPLLKQGWKDNIEVTARYVAGATEGISSIILAYTGLSTVLGSAQWVVGAVQGFIQFEAAASKVIWSIEGNITRAFSLFGRLARELPSLASAIATVMPDTLGGMGVGGSAFDYMAEGSASGQVASALGGGAGRGEERRYRRQGPTQLQNAQQDLNQINKMLAQRNTTEKDYVALLKQQENAKSRISTLENEIRQKQLEAGSPVEEVYEKEVNAADAAIKKIDKLRKQSVQNAINANDQINKQDKDAFLRRYKEEETASKKLSDEKKKQERELRTARLRTIRDAERAEEQRQRRMGRLRENLMLGAGFPMLFGGGLGAVAGGTLGAVSQSYMGSEGGFGSQILLSALGQRIDDFVGKTAELGQAFNKINPDVDAVIASLGETNTAYGQHLATIKELKGEEAAMAEARKRLTFLVGAEGVNALEQFGEETQQLGNEWTKVITNLQVGIAGLINSSGILKHLIDMIGKKPIVERAWESVQKGTASEETKSLVERMQASGQGLGPLRGYFGGDRLEDMQDLVAESQLRDEAAAKSKLYGSITGKDSKTKIQILEEEREHLERSLQIGSKAAEQEKEALEILKEQNAVNNTNLELGDTKILQNIQYRDELKEQLEMWNQIKDTIAGGLTNAIMGLIDGTKTLSESLAGILKQIAQILIQKAIMSAIDKIPFGGGGVTTGETTPVNKFATGRRITNYATGGMVTRPTYALIGEAGENEYVIPSSKMQGAMERYSAGARGQGVIPGSGTVASGSGVSSSPTVVNYTGPVLSFDSEAYVPKSAIPEIINSAARRGAQEGQSKVFSQLKNSRSQRSRVGL